MELPTYQQLERRQQELLEKQSELYSRHNAEGGTYLEDEPWYEELIAVEAQIETLEGELDALDVKAMHEDKDDEQLIAVFLAVDGIPIDPQLPENWDCTPNDQRPACHSLLWGRPYITTNRAPTEELKERWLEAWPEGIRYDVRCLDGGAWDRSTAHGCYKTLEEAMAVATELL